MRALLFLTFITVAFLKLDGPFEKFIGKQYGDGVSKMLSLKDGRYGSESFGGQKQKSKKRPIIFVHGLRNVAGTLWKQRLVFSQHGWPVGHLIGTTYGPGEVDVAKGLTVTLKCSYVKQIRFLIEATYRFFKRRVDVIAYSMGSPVARKAIFGGKCVDTNEDIGSPLTDKIGTFLSVAGANQGVVWCSVPFPGLCNIVNGLSCISKFILDINKRSGYEGAHRYSMYSENDPVIGNVNGCFKNCALMPNSTTTNGKNHVQAMHQTIDLQVKIISRHN